MWKKKANKVKQGRAGTSRDEQGLVGNGNRILCRKKFSLLFRANPFYSVLIREKGFTLIEVMIAIAIIAIALVVILHSYGLGVSMANESQDFSLATLFAQEKMAEIEMEGFPEIGEKKGDFGKEYHRFTWKEIVAETPMEDLRKVTLTISWDEKNIEVITYITKRK